MSLSRPSRLRPIPLKNDGPLGYWAPTLTCPRMRPALTPIFKTEPLSLAELLLCLGASGMVFVAVEIKKAWLRRKRQSLASAIAT